MIHPAANVRPVLEDPICQDEQVIGNCQVRTQFYNLQRCTPTFSPQTLFPQTLESLFVISYFVDHVTISRATECHLPYGITVLI